jgi:hypothetical protein
VAEGVTVVVEIEDEGTEAVETIVEVLSPVARAVMTE